MLSMEEGQLSSYHSLQAISRSHQLYETLLKNILLLDILQNYLSILVNCLVLFFIDYL